ncbi:hypothetical protein [Plantactinospora sp. WMMB782]|uniref:hypothetical protein n=1 Tax=Plantactinospora sp. WMMB782 TaxID=3404121 RepID=UPI003B93D224
MPSFIVKYRVDVEVEVDALGIAEADWNALRVLRAGLPMGGLVPVDAPPEGKAPKVPGVLRLKLDTGLAEIRRGRLSEQPEGV